MDKQKKSYILGISAILLWSTVATSFKFALSELNYIQTIFYSVLFSTIILFIYLLFEKKHRLIFSSSSKQYAFSAFLGFLNPFLYYVVLLKAYSLLPAQLAQPLNYTWPMMLVLLSVPLLKKKIKLIDFIAIIISFCGVILISLKDNFSISNIDEPFGILLATGSSIIWALFWIFNIKDSRDEVVKLFLNFFFGLIFISILMALTNNFTIPSQKGFLSTLYISFFEMGITFILWLKALKLSEKQERLSNLVYISPFMSLFFINIFLHENIYKTTIIGLVLIVLGIFIQNIFSKKKKIKA